MNSLSRVVTDGITTNNTTGLKFDDNKIRYELIPPRPIEGLAKILTFGAQKYEDDNWRKVTPVSRYYGALIRHLEAVRMGEWLDPESGLPHLDHVLCNAVFLRELEWKKDIG